MGTRVLYMIINVQFLSYLVLHLGFSIQALKIWCVLFFTWGSFLHLQFIFIQSSELFWGREFSFIVCTLKSRYLFIWTGQYFHNWCPFMVSYWYLLDSSSHFPFPFQQLSLLPLMEPLIGVNFAHFLPYGSRELNGENRLSGSFGSASLDGVSDYYSQLIYKVCCCDQIYSEHFFTFKWTECAKCFFSFAFCTFLYSKTTWAIPQHPLPLCLLPHLL